jgi:ATP-dependent RNA helicase DDX27
VRDAADDIKDIEKQERTEKELRVAEMETNKAMCVRRNRHRFTVIFANILVHRAPGRNLLKHSKEIHSRPARTWFQDEKEKNNVVKKWREVRER